MAKKKLSPSVAKREVTLDQHQALKRRVQKLETTVALMEHIIKTFSHGSGDVEPSGPPVTANEPAAAPALGGE